MNRVISMNSSLFLLSLGLLVSRSVKAARRTRASFERSSLYTCDFDSAPCLTMMVSPGGRPYSPKPQHVGQPFLAERDGVALALLTQNQQQPAQARGRIVHRIAQRGLLNLAHQRHVIASEDIIDRLALTHCAAKVRDRNP